MPPIRAVLTAAATVATMATTTAAIVAPAADATPTGEVCDLIAVDTAALLREIPLVKALAGGHDVTPDQIVQARATLGCGPAPKRTEAQARAALCGALTVDRVDRLLVATNASEQVRGVVAGVPDGALASALGTARDSLGCAALTTAPATPPPGSFKDLDCGDFATRADAQAVLDSGDGDPARLDGDANGLACESLPGGGQVKVFPRGSVATGGWGGDE